MDCSFPIDNNFHHNQHQPLFSSEQKRGWSGVIDHIKNAIPNSFDSPNTGILREYQFTKINPDHTQTIVFEEATERGVSTFIFTDGSKGVFHHKMGKLDGPGTYVAVDGSIEEFLFEQGKCKNAKVYSEQFIEEVSCIFGREPHGNATQRLPDGSLEKFTYNFGIKTGPAKRIFSDGHIENFTYVDGIESGMATSTFSDGSHEFYEYNQGKKHGLCIVTLPDGFVCKSNLTYGIPINFKPCKISFAKTPSLSSIKMVISTPPMVFEIPRERLSKLSSKFNTGLDWLKKYEAEEYAINTDALDLEITVAFVNFLRLGKVLFTEDNFWPLFQLADEHNIKPLFKKCFSFAKENLTTDLIYEFGTSIGSVELIDFCLSKESIPDLIHQLNNGEITPYDLGLVGVGRISDFFGEYCSEILRLDLRKKTTGFHITNDDIEEASKKFPDLKNLLLGIRTLLTDKSTHHLARLKALETLDISYTGITDLSFLKNLKCLKVLNLSGCKKIKDLNILQNLDSLEKVHLTKCSQLSEIFDIQPLRDKGIGVVWSASARDMFLYLHRVSEHRSIPITTNFTQVLVLHQSKLNQNVALNQGK